MTPVHSLIGGIAVGVLELAQDLRFTDHHGIEACRHAVKMGDGVRAAVQVNEVVNIIFLDIAGGKKKFFDGADGFRLVGAGKDHLDPVAG